MIQPASGFSRAIRAAVVLLPMVMATPWLNPISTAARQNSSQQSSAQSLSPGVPIERELSGGQAHEYKIALMAGQGIKIKAEQRGIDLVLLLNGTDGKELFEENGWDENYGTELIVWAAEVSGTYQLQVRAAGKEAPVGRYELRLETPQADERFATAIQKFNEGMQLATLKDKKLAQSLSRFEESLDLWRALGDRDMEGRALFFAASKAYDLNEFPKTIDYSLRALEIFRAFGMKKEEYVTLSVITSGYAGTGDYLKALFYDRQRIPLLPVASPVAAVNLHTNLGILSRQIGDYQKAQEHLGEALAKARGLGAKREELLALSALATLSFVSNEPLKSAEYIQAALPLSRELKQPLREGRLLLQLGQIYARASEPQQATSLFKQAVQLLNRPEGRADRAQTLMALSDTLRETGDTVAAEETLNQALGLARETGARASEMRILTRIGNILSDRGDFQKALEYQQQAHDFLHANANLGEEVSALMDLARTYELMGQRQRARGLLDQALTLTRTLTGGGAEAAILRRQALFARDDGDLKQARELIEAAIRSREELRNKFAGQSLKASYGASSQDFYEAYLDILMRLHEQSPREGYAALALGVSESARARSLLDLLGESRADIRQGADPALLDKERTLQRQLGAKDTAYRELASNKRTAPSAEGVAKEINELAAQLQLLEAQIRTSSPRYAALTQPQPLTSSEIQSQLLDEDTALLEFSLGEKKSWLWTVTKSSLSVYSLPPRKEIETAARGVYELLIARQPRKGESEAAYQSRTSRADAKYKTEARALSQMLLGQAAARLNQEWKGNRLLIVASGALEYLPFAALPVPSEEARPEDSLPLLSQYEIVNLPSASTLAVVRRETAGRSSATKSVAVLADPVFEANDPRLSKVAQKKTTGNIFMTGRAAGDPPAPPGFDSELGRALRSFGDSGGRDGFSRLPFSREEADVIASLVAKDAVLKAVDFRANRTIATSGELSRYRLVHFATHGLLNGEHPELSGLVLSLVDESGKPQDGFLRTHEIFNLQLPADVIVLSACQTALGREVRGEGVVGLTRAFMYAGARRVTASLWQVDDLATAELMKLFYRGMLKDGLRPASALRAAQLEMAKQKRWTSPYFWAAFVMQGEWK